MMKNKIKRKINLGTLFGAVFLFILAALALVPLLQVFINSFRSDVDIKSMPLGISGNLTLENYGDTWNIGEYGTAFINSLIICTVTIILVIVFGGICAYALSKIKFRSKGFFIFYFFVSLTLPSFLYIVPDYTIMSKLGLINSRWALILAYTAMELPFSILLLRTSLAGIPKELEEAAKLDGCSDLQCMTKVVLPIAKPILLTIAILVFVAAWNEFLWANTFITDDALRTVATRYIRFTGRYSSNYARIYTASVFTIAPLMVVYLLFSNRFIEGMTSGSMKG